MGLLYNTCLFIIHAYLLISIYYDKNPKSSAISKFNPNPIALSHNKIIEFKSKKSLIVAGE
ncbi:hypothetical protein A3305_06240 [Rickettsia amblyommatis]|uniref:Uncharacterized protein n=1 Tax=Rickettsia amblyommatis (strain GAT-30V) TaxID=1105111 RepID=H8K5K4_RICAG|nr:hypothetical protein MCE_04510 [Rickettsia amblyommatis str. GAT-30V]ARD87959.1 hypothetical protein A3305_06240 [Rickettsia amblyommatis]KJV93270.1 hypothetical protein RAMDARK_0929 [Rickettsia amblyommatis str. Darkwater]